MFFIEKFFKYVTVILFIFFAACQAYANDRDKIIGVYKLYREANREFIATQDLRKKNELRSNLERIAEQEFNPYLANTKEIVCAQKDHELLNEFLKVILELKNSADEYPLIVLGDIYVCAPDLMAETILAFGNEADRDILSKIAIHSLNYPLANNSITKSELSVLRERLQ
jgi:hypothetical protein